MAEAFADLLTDQKAAAFELHERSLDSQGNEKYIKTDKDQIAQKTRIMGLATSVANECSGQSFTERIKWISEKRQEGNKLYKENKYEDALNLYITTLCALDFKTCSGEVSEEQDKMA